MNKIHDDNTFSEHGFVSSIPYKDGFMVSWLDGRNTYGVGDHGHAKGAMTIRSAVLDFNGTEILSLYQGSFKGQKGDKVNFAIDQNKILFFDEKGISVQ